MCVCVFGVVDQSESVSHAHQKRMTGPPGFALRITEHGAGLCLGDVGCSPKPRLDLR